MLNEHMASPSGLKHVAWPLGIGPPRVRVLTARNHGQGGRPSPQQIVGDSELENRALKELAQGKW